jgi:lipoate-protein ligase A
VLLDNNQIFYHLILNRKNPKVPYSPDGFFRRFLQPVIKTYKELGITAEYRPLCDLVVNEKKISGNGGGEVGECKVLGGSILLDFDYETMANAMLLPNSLRSRYHDMMQTNLTTLQKELVTIPSKNEICSILSSKFSDILGPMTEAKIDLEITKKTMELKKQYFSDKWLYQRGTKQIGREIKVREGVILFHKIFNTQKGIGEIHFEIEENKVNKVTFSKNFLLDNSQQHNIEKRLINLDFDKELLVNKTIKMIDKYVGVVVA